MNKKYGCDVVDEDELKQVFGDEFIDDLKKMGVVEVLRLNRRKKGMTSSGDELGCHYNVMSLVSAFGGRHKHGFLIESKDKKEGLLAFHSAWLSPEKKLVCVTPRDINNSSKTDVFFFMFSDDGSLDVDYDDVAYFNRTFCPLERTRQMKGLVGYSISHYRQAKQVKTGFTQEIMNGLVDIHLTDRFSKKSILTQKTFDEIVQTPYAKKMRDIYRIAPVNKKQVRKTKKRMDTLSFNFSTA